MKFPYPRVIIGSKQQPEMKLNSGSWIRTNNAHGWNQRGVPAGEQITGFWPVEIAGDGTCRFDVRRWPHEVDLPMQAGLPVKKDSDGSKFGKPFFYDAGVALPITAVRIKVGELEFEKQIEEGDTCAVFEMNLEAGPTRAEAWFVRSDGKEHGSYYTYVTEVEQQ